MKYIKKFENIIEYKIGDYVLIQGSYFVNGKNTPGKIIEDDKTSVPLLVNICASDNIWISSEMIFRKLTSEESEKFELDCASKKYNL